MPPALSAAVRDRAEGASIEIAPGTYELDAPLEPLRSRELLWRARHLVEVRGEQLVALRVEQRNRLGADKASQWHNNGDRCYWRSAAGTESGHFC